MTILRTTWSTFLILYPFFCFSMQQTSTQKTPYVEGDITDFVWTPRGTHLIIAKKTEKGARVYSRSLEQIGFLATAQPIIKLACSRAQERLLVGLKTGVLEIFALNDLRSSVSLDIPKRMVHEIAWIGNSPYFLAYLKNPEPHEPGQNTHYPSQSALGIYDACHGTLVKECIIPDHVLKVAPAPSGGVAALVTDTRNSRNPALSLEEPAIQQALQLFSVSQSLDIQPILKEPLIFVDAIKALTWSPDSSFLAVLFESGLLVMIDAQGTILGEYPLEACQRITGTISWSSIGNLLALPATVEAVHLYDPAKPAEPKDIILLDQYIQRTHARKPLLANKIAWSTTSKDLAMLIVDLGQGAASSLSKLIVIPYSK